MRVNPKTGEHSSISSKTANLADEVDFSPFFCIENLFLKLTTIVGVSKAVVDNVIFCHQEDSNW